MKPAKRVVKRKAKTSRSSEKVHPSVRFRQTRATNKQQKRNTNSKRVVKKTSQNSFLNLFTPTGWLSVLVLLAVVSFSTWFFVLTPKFLVKEIRVEDQTVLSSGELQFLFQELKNQKLAGLIPANHLAIVSSQRFNNIVEKHFPQLKGDVQFKKHWPNALSITLEAKQPVFLYQTDEEANYILDSEGVVMGSVPKSAEVDLVPLRGNFEETPADVFQLEFNPLSFIIDLHSHWPKEWEFQPQEYQIKSDHSFSDVEILIDQGWYLKLSSESDALEIHQLLEIIFEHEIQEHEQNLVYLDLRLPTRAFYCLIGSPCANQ